MIIVIVVDIVKDELRRIQMSSTNRTDVKHHRLNINKSMISIDDLTACLVSRTPFFAFAFISSRLVFPNKFISIDLLVVYLISSLSKSDPDKRRISHSSSSFSPFFFVRYFVLQRLWWHRISLPTGSMRCIQKQEFFFLHPPALSIIIGLFIFVFWLISTHVYLQKNSSRLVYLFVYNCGLLFWCFSLPIGLCFSVDLSESMSRKWLVPLSTRTVS